MSRSDVFVLIRVPSFNNYRQVSSIAAQGPHTTYRVLHKILRKKRGWEGRGGEGTERGGEERGWRGGMGRRGKGRRGERGGGKGRKEEERRGEGRGGQGILQ